MSFRNSLSSFTKPSGSLMIDAICLAMLPISLVAPTSTPAGNTSGNMSATFSPKRPARSPTSSRLTDEIMHSMNFTTASRGRVIGSAIAPAIETVAPRSASCALARRTGFCIRSA